MDLPSRTEKSQSPGISGGRGLLHYAMEATKAVSTAEDTITAKGRHGYVTSKGEWLRAVSRKIRSGRLFIDTVSAYCLEK